MKVLFTNTGSWGTGAGTVINGVVDELLRLGHTAKVVFPDLGLPSPDTDKYYGNPELYHIIKFPVEYRGETFPTFPLMIPDPNPRSGVDPWTYKDMTERQFDLYTDFLREELGRVVEEFRPDVIETEHVWLMGYVLSEFSCPYVVGAHNSDQMGFRFDRRMQPYARDCAQAAKYIFAISDFVKHEVVSLYGVSGEKVVVIPNGYDQELYQPRAVSKEELFKEHNVGADLTLPVITFAGKLSKTKGIDILLQANAILQKRIPFTLLIFGAGGLGEVLGRPPTEQEVKNTFFLGHVTPEVLAHFHNVADLSVAPSRQEGFSVAALEAMGCGLPVVGTSTGQLEKFIVGKIVPPEDAEKLAEAMEEILSLAPQDRKELSEKARSAASEFSWRHNVEKRLIHYQKAASG